jgi:hypothetical protein
MELSSRVWLTTLCVLCRKSTNPSWEENEPSAAAAKEDPTLDVEESTPLPQGETVAPGVEATPLEATLVEVK